MKKLLALLLLTLSCCNLPKDPKDSLSKARSHGLRIGVVHHPPYCFMNGGKPGGSEVAIINAFAKQNGLKPIYVYGSESSLVKQLEAYKLDVVLGGYEKDTPWKESAGVTTPYNNTNCLLVAPGENDLLYLLEGHLLKLKEHGH